MLTASISRNALLLGLFAVVSTAIIAGTFLGTGDKIRDNIRQAEERALLEIIPKSRHINSMLDDAQLIHDTELLGLRNAKHLYIARFDDKPVAIILPATARDGYTGDIDMIIGINVDGTIAGVRILSHRETPGLGDAIDKKKSDCVDGFIGRSLLNPSLEQWTVKKDNGVFDQFTGATITPRAVSKSIAKALQYFQQHQQRILDSSKPSTPEANHG
jgi:electron transport complex protein RnfG